ncbi:hypothetical protein EG240_10540 [Paenimyroides tangerinum]|uniref:Uncharacterized protein n=1 Tax=Paenimyroides tangerinum TaxID=2488728 RepID=A0A3P3W779_9FLAO|nr:hypothetical protein [Paenimyroides tangerinum]RRJ89826.1 hypothetical protein EG240_10540 [Paenimyroides tangerinum]
MNWSDPNETEEEYLARKDEEVRASMGVMSMLMGFLVLFLKIAAVFGIFIYSGYLLSQKLLKGETDQLKIWGLSLIFAYLILCIVYFLKGIIIGFRAKNNKLWILPWIICIILCCIFPAFIIKAVVAGMFHITKRQDVWCLVFSWGAFLFSSFYIYGIYQFKTPSAPKFLYWSYNLGLKLLV